MELVVASEVTAPHGNLKVMMKTGLQAAISIPQQTTAPQVL